MVVVRTVVTALPQTASTEKTYRIDPAPAALPVKPTATPGTAMIGVNLAQLLADLEAESRRVIGPSPPPRS